MSKEAVRIGRYSFTWKSKNMEETKKRKKREPKPSSSCSSDRCKFRSDRPKVANSSSSCSTVPSNSAPECCSAEKEIPEDQSAPLEIHPSTSALSVAVATSFGPVTTSDEPVTTPVGPVTTSVGPVATSVGHELQMPTLCGQPVKLVLPKLGVCTCEIKCPLHSIFTMSSKACESIKGNPMIEPYPETELDSVVERLCAEQDRQNQMDNVNPESMQKEQKEYVELYELRKEVLGEAGCLSYQEFQDVYKQTGLELDDRLSIIIENIKVLEQRLAYHVSFAKTIPGFRSMLISEQADLVKYSLFEASVLAWDYEFNTELGVVTWQNGKQWHLEEYGKFFDPDFLNAKVKLMTKMKEVKLSREEMALLRAIVVMYSDRCEQKIRAQVDECQGHLIACLRHVVKKQYEDAGSRLRELFDLLLDLRLLTDWENKAVRQIILDYPVTQEFAFVKEILL